MKKAIAVPAVALLLVTGCSSAAAGPGTPTGTGPAAPTPSAVPAQRVSEERACGSLLETNGEGPLYQAIYAVKVGDGTSGFQASTETSRTLDTQLDGIADSAPQEMGAALAELSSPIKITIQRAAEPNLPWDFNIESWKGAVAELLARCAPYETATAGGAGLPSVPAADTADKTSAGNPGYPMIVDAGSLDYRVAAWFGNRLADGRVVALAPGLYSAYDPARPDLQSYYVPDNAVGDSIMKQIVFPGSGKSATWAGVSPSPQEAQ